MKMMRNKERIYGFGQRSKAARPVLLSKTMCPFFALAIIFTLPRLPAGRQGSAIFWFYGR